MAVNRATSTERMTISSNTADTATDMPLEQESREPVAEVSPSTAERQAGYPAARQQPCSKKVDNLRKIGSP